MLPTPPQPLLFGVLESSTQHTSAVTAGMLTLLAECYQRNANSGQTVPGAESLSALVGLILEGKSEDIRTSLRLLNYLDREMKDGGICITVLTIWG